VFIHCQFITRLLAAVQASGAVFRCWCTDWQRNRLPTKQLGGGDGALFEVDVAVVGFRAMRTHAGRHDKIFG
jgi:hypothetical protein